jgi:hypothetical protein
VQIAVRDPLVLRRPEKAVNIQANAGNLRGMPASQMRNNMLVEIKKLREYLPFLGRVYRKLRTTREALALVSRQRDLTEAQLRHDQSVAESKYIRARFSEFLQVIQPHDVAKCVKVRIGGPYDGGYVMVDDFGSAKVAISIGIGHDVSWDRDITARGIRVTQFDHTVDAPPISDENISFIKKRIVDISKHADEVTLGRILQFEGYQNDRNIILKMDIEGDEWQVLDSISNVDLARFRQIVVEFHWLRNFSADDWSARAIRVVRKLTQYHSVVHFHGNNVAGFAILGGIAFPNVFELTFLRRDGLDFSRSLQTWPTELDAPNCPERADLYIGTMPFLSQL